MGVFEIVKRMHPLFLIIAGAAIWTVGDIFMKFWIANNKLSYAVIGILIWTVGLLFLAQSFRYKNMAVASTMMVAVNSILLVAISWFYFKEQLTMTQLVGITFGLVGLFLLETN